MSAQLNRFFNPFKLGQKFTLLLLIIFLGGIAISGITLSFVLNYNARMQVSSEAIALLKTMNAVRNYTDTQIEPELSPRLEREFLPQAVPSYSAREVFETIRQDPKWETFFYKEATLNPTNLRDRADEFEAAIVQSFRQNPDLGELTGFRPSPTGKLFYIARPLAVTSQSCLACHGSVADAPQSLLDRYGTQNGFGWKLNEIIGTQIIFVPSDAVYQRIRQSKIIILGIVIASFAIATFSVNLWLKKYVVKPLNRMADVAEAVSTGDLEAEFDPSSQDEVGRLAIAFNRLKTSLVMALKRLDRYRHSQ